MRNRTRVTRCLPVLMVLLTLTAVGCTAPPPGGAGSTATPGGPTAATIATAEAATTALPTTEIATIAPGPTEEAATTPLPTTDIPAGFDTVSRPNLCPIDNANLTSVRDIAPGIDPTSNPALGPGVFSATVPYTNGNGQRFAITASGRNPARVQSFLLDLQLCLEAIDQVSAGPGTYLAGIETDGHDKPDEPPFKEGASIVERLLVGPTSEPNILVEMDWLDAGELGSKASDYAIYYVFDPPIGSNEWQGYIAKCQKEAWARIRVSGGGATVYTYINYAFNHHATAYAVNTSNWVGGKALVNRTYDASVQGLQNGSTYEIEGGWTRGTGGGC